MKNKLFASVPNILFGSVVASMNIVWDGGSSKVLSKALDASVVNMWASSII